MAIGQNEKNETKKDEMTYEAKTRRYGKGRNSGFLQRFKDINT
jgi:hypothetical protein